MAKHLVAVYGTLREGQGNWRWALKDRAHKLGASLVQGFDMYSTGGFPAVVHTTEQKAPIAVEVYEVDDDVFRDLDRLEGYPHMYTREQIDTPYGEAWLYIWNSGVQHLDFIEGGDWVAYREEGYRDRRYA